MPSLRAPRAGRLDVLVSELVPELSRAAAARLVRDGRVAIAGGVVQRPSAKVRLGDLLTVEVPPPRPSALVPEDLPLQIVHQDADLAVIDKAAGMVVHPAPGHTEGTLVHALLHHLDDLSGVGGEQRPGIVHRLDRGTTGLLVVAKHDRAHRHLAEQFAHHTAGRTYLALCHGSPADDAGTITSQLARHPRVRVRMASVASGGRHAVTHWRVRARADAVSLLQCRLQTGRTHQVRVHLCEQGWPLLGDGVYRRRSARLPAGLRSLISPGGDRPMLHAWQLRLIHPSTGASLCFTAPIPDDMAMALAALGIEPPQPEPAPG